jgi:PKD repeat protein
MKNTVPHLFLAIIATLMLTTCSLDKIDDLKSVNGCPNAPVANFTPDKANCAAPCTVTFTNASTGATTYAWDFGAGGGTSTDAAPSHTFTTAGTYSVRLIATGAGGCKDTTNRDIIIVTPGAMPVAAFTITNNACFAACQMVFTNTSVDATSFSWDFGDGTPVVTQTNPTHTFDLPGDYNVKLTAINSGGSDTETKPVQVKTITFKKTFGGANSDLGKSVQQTQDGGYILLGETESEGAGLSDFYLIKTNNIGNLVWKKVFGGPVFEYANSVQQTQDGGYILAGSTSSEGAGSVDMYLIKVGFSGNLEWSKTFGGTNIDFAGSVQQTQDGGYILAGSTSSEGAGESDLYLVKTDNLGNLVWSKTFGGTNNDFAGSVQQTQDGGYILAGSTDSEGAGNTDAYLVKTDNLGNLVWKKTFGDADNEGIESIQQTQDGGYILMGNGSGLSSPYSDFYLVKTDISGNLGWSKKFGGISSEHGHSVQQTQDGGYILLGDTYSEGAGAHDFYLVKTDDTGNLVWKKTFGGANSDLGYSVQQTQDGGYILLGETYSEGAGSNDVYLIKTDKDGNVQ